MAACGNEGLTGLDNCGGLKKGAVMRTDFLVQTRGASKSIHNTADRQWFLVTEAPSASEKTQFLQNIEARGQGSEVLKATTLPSWKNSHQNHVTNSTEFRYSLRSQSNRNGTGRELPIPATAEYQTEKNASPQGYVVLSPVSHRCDSWDL